MSCTTVGPVFQDNVLVPRSRAVVGRYEPLESLASDSLGDDPSEVVSFPREGEVKEGRVDELLYHRCCSQVLVAAVTDQVPGLEPSYLAEIHGWVDPFEDIQSVAASSSSALPDRTISTGDFP